MGLDILMDIMRRRANLLGIVGINLKTRGYSTLLYGYYSEEQG